MAALKSYQIIPTIKSSPDSWYVIFIYCLLDILDIMLRDYGFYLFIIFY